MEDTFYCGKCGIHKPLSQKRKSPAGIRPVCSECVRKAKNRQRVSEKARDAARARSVGKIDHLMPNAVGNATERSDGRR